jgi:hypothetical protein
LVVDDINGIDSVSRVGVEQLLIFVNFPENDLSIEATRDDSVLGVSIDCHNVSSMTVVRIDILHLSQIPDFKRTVLRNSVELIVFSIHSNSCNSVSMSEELRDLLLVVDVPNPDDSVFSSSDHQFTIRRNC